MMNSPHNKAAAALRGHTFRAALTTLLGLLLGLLLRLIAAAPLAAALYGYRPINPPILSVIAGCALSALLYFLLAVPLRMAVRRGYAEAIHFGSELRCVWGNAWRLQLGRMLRTAWYHLPLIAMLLLTYHDLKLSSALAPLKRMSWAGALPAKLLGLESGVIAGAAVLGLIFLLCALLSLIGARRYLMLDILAPDTERPFEKARAGQKAARPALRRATLINFLLCLPFALVTLGILAWGVASTLTGDVVSDLITVLITLLEMNFPRLSLILVLVAFAVLYLPLALYRKAALAAALLPGDAA